MTRIDAERMPEFDAAEILREAELAHPHNTEKRAYYIAARLVDRSGKLRPAEEVNTAFARVQSVIFEMLHEGAS